MTLLAGQLLSAAALNAEIDPAWTDFSSAFTLTAPTTNPTKGNSTYSAQYRRGPSHKLVHYEGKITIGSTFVAGSGIYRFALPVNADTTAIANAVGSGYIFDAGTANRQATIRIDAATYLTMYLHDSLSAITNAGSGTAWATGDILAWSVWYRPA